MSSPVCMYASKPCYEPRAIKDSGELHRLCDFHRSKANEAQRRWHSRHCSGTEPIPPKKRKNNSTVASRPIRKRQRSPKAVEDVIELAVSAIQAPLLPYSDVVAPEPEFLSDEDFVLLDECFGQAETGSLKFESESMEWLLNSHQLAPQFFANV